MKLLDTNVIVYAVGRPHPYKRACAKVLQDAVDGIYDYRVDTELFQEILYLYTARGERKLGLSTCADLLLLFPDPFPITRDDIAVAHRLMTSYPRLAPRDAIHGAVVQVNHLEGIVSADRIFDEIDSCTRFDPLVIYPEP